MSQRKRYDANFKAKIALEAIKGERTVAELAGEYGLHPNQISTWKKQALAGLPGVMNDKRTKEAKQQEAKEDQLYRKIGQLEIELDWLKKKSGQLR